MAEPFTILGAVPYVFGADAGAVSTWCQQVLGFVERGRCSDDDGAVSNVELAHGGVEVWLDGPVPDWPQQMEGLGSWIGLQVDDLDAVHARLQDLGVAVAPPVGRGFGTRHLTVVDPEGHQWGLIERTRPTRQDRGNTPWPLGVRGVIGAEAGVPDSRSLEVSGAFESRALTLPRREAASCTSSRRWRTRCGRSVR